MIHQHRFLSMGTMITVTVSAGAWTRRRRIADALAAVQERMDAFGHDFWGFGDGRLAQMNRELAAGRVSAIPDDMRPLFERALSLRDATSGLFDPRIGALVRAWGFDDPARQRSAPPGAAEVRVALASPAWDFGAIGKGFIVDECLDLLAARGFAHACIDAGGNVAVRGLRAGRPWRVGIRDPRDADALVARLDARDESVITHADDQRFFEHDGVRYSHILDPRTGRPARGLRSVTVVHRDGTLADAGGAALFVAGRDWQRLAARLQLDQVMAIDDDGEIELTPALARRLVVLTER
ncbi:MAG TPA: FAD:protein FMN transferase [Nevskiaceae bacterium]|nr:FAD:protein FMN transferase [Nevskiaceae bacterium]